MTSVVALGEAKQPWFWGITDAIVLVLLLANVLLLVIVHVRRARQFFRRRRENRCRDLVERLLSEIAAPTPAHDALWVRREIGGLDGLERPIAARMLIERLSAASEQERAHMLAVLREVGGLEMILRSTRRRMPWRRALAVRTLGWTGAPEAVPVLLEAVSDRNRYVRSSAVRALGRIGDARALPLLGELFRTPGRVEPGVSYDALLAFGTAAAPLFAGGLRSDAESVRVASCFGVAALSEPEDGRRLLEPLLADERAPVRMAAAESLGHVGGALLPDALARATRDEQRGA